MSDITPTRSAAIELKHERRVMHEGCVFLDEKCMLLAGEMVRELRRYELLQREFHAAERTARTTLKAALARHGLQGLQVYPAADLAAANFVCRARRLMGVVLQDADLAGLLAPQAVPLHPSPEAEACRRQFAEALRQAAVLAAVSGNLERLYLEYRRASRRARALQDVLLPEIERTLSEVESRLEEFEQEDAVWMRHGSGKA